MRSLYDTEADALAIDLVERPSAVDSARVGMVRVSRDETGRAVSLEALYPTRPELWASLRDVCERYALDTGAVTAAARAGLAARGREVTLEVGEVVA